MHGAARLTAVALLAFVPRAAYCAVGFNCSHVFLLLRLRRDEGRGVCRNMTFLKEVITPQSGQKGMIRASGERRYSNGEKR